MQSGRSEFLVGEGTDQILARALTTLPETNGSPLKIGPPQGNLSCNQREPRRYDSFREGIFV